MAPGLTPGDGDRLFLVGPFAPSLAGSELAKQRGELDAGLPQVEIVEVEKAIALVRDLVRAGVASAAHDASDGGLACALAEMAIAAGTGLEIDLDPIVELRGASGETCLSARGRAESSWRSAIAMPSRSSNGQRRRASRPSSWGR